MKNLHEITIKGLPKDVIEHVPVVYRDKTEKELAREYQVMGDLYNTAYWIVGASRNNGQIKEDEKMVRQGIWRLFWDNNHSDYSQALRIKVNDRIAIKRMRGKGRKGLLIMHIGVVKKTPTRVLKHYTCEVDWLVTDLERVVEVSKNNFGSIRRYTKESLPETKQWLEEIFSI